MLKVIRELLLKMVDNIDAGNSNLTEDEALQAISYLKELTNKEKRLSKCEAYRYLNHLEMHICEALDINPYSEEAAILSGETAMQILNEALYNIAEL